MDKKVTTKLTFRMTTPKWKKIEMEMKMEPRKWIKYNYLDVIY